MTLLNSKWMIAILVLLVALIVLYLMGRKSVRSELIIEATPNQIWSVLMDTKAYRDWNPVLIPIEGELKEGTKVKYEFRQDENTKSEIPSTVKKMVKDELLNQGGGMPGVLTFDHKYILKPATGGTLVIINEDYRGVGVVFWNPAPVEEAYKRLNDALRKRVLELADQKQK